MEAYAQKKIPSQVNEFNKTNDQQVFITHLNVQGLTSVKAAYIDQDPLLNKSDIICFSETHLSDNFDWMAKQVCPPHYTITQMGSNKNGGGGLAICIKNEMGPVTVISTSMECLHISISKERHKLHIMCCYKERHKNLQSFTDRLCKNISQLPPDAQCVIVGDFNNDLLWKKETYLLERLAELQFSQHITDATRYDSNSGTLIDHIYTKDISAIATKLTDCLYSDHDATAIVIR